MMKEREFFQTKFRLYHLVVLILFLFFSRTTLLASIFEYDIIVEQLDLQNYSTPIPNSTVGLITVFYSPITDPLYINFVAKDGADNPVWIVKNLYLPSNTFSAVKQEISVRFNLADLGYKAGDDVTTIQLNVELTKELLTTAPSPLSYTKVDVTDLIEDAYNEIIKDLKVPAIEIPEELKFSEDEKITDIVYRGCDIPVIDLDDATYPDDENYSGDLCACVPASAASSLKWLDKVHEEIVITSDERETMAELSALMQRKPNEGVSIDNFIKGKLDYIQKNELKINVKFQSYGLTDDVGSESGKTTARNDNGTDIYPSWKWLKHQLDDGEDVEIMYYWKDGEDVRGHAVVVTGYELTSENRLRLKFKHDLYQAGEGGTKQECDDLVKDSEGRLILVNHNAIIIHAVAESPGTPFPVELSAFAASVEKNSVYLKWQTTSETNNYGFELLRGDTQIAFISGHGTTMQEHDYQFIDQNLKPGVYNYQLYQIDFDGTRTFAGKVEAAIQNVPVEFSLAQNYPNPFNASTRINFTLPTRELVRLTIYNVLGKEVAQLLNEEKLAGQHEILFNASDFTSGIYYYKLEAGTFTEMRKFILLK